jgi:YaaC-like Protein
MSAPVPTPLSGGLRIGRSWADLGLSSREMIWRDLRALRAQPPGQASSGQRHKVFASALQQAEELFTAAAAIGPSSQPILLFYGLSQAGRAIAAASKSASGTNWRLTGHGIKVRNLQHPVLHEIAVADQGTGSFTQLGPLLRSGSLPNGASLGELWATIPDLYMTPINYGSSVYKRVLRLDDVGIGGGKITAWVRGLPWRFTDPYTEADAVAYLASYPTLAGSVSPGPGNQFHPEQPAVTTGVPRAWPMPADQDLDAFEESRTWPYRGDDERCVFPALGGSTVPLHPLLAWWAILYSLSMLARYEPATWSEHLDVDSSRDAVPLETALSRALDTCPQLILHAIRAVSR